MRNLLIFCSALALGAAPLSAQLKAPAVGNVRYAGGGVHSLYGLDANFVLGPEWLVASAVSFSEAGGLIAAPGKIQLLKRDGSVAGEYATSEAAPLLGIGGDLNTAVAWLPSSHTLLWWKDRMFRTTEVAGGLPGVATSIQSDGDVASLLVTARDGYVLKTTIDLKTGEITSTEIVPGARGPAFAQGPFVVFRNEQGLAIEDASGNTRVLDFAASDPVFERISPDWLHISSASMKQDWALHLNNSVCKLWLLPEPGTAK